MSKQLDQSTKSINARRKKALGFLQGQLKVGTKLHWKTRQPVELTQADASRVKSQIEILIKRIF